MFFVVFYHQFLYFFDPYQDQEPRLGGALFDFSNIIEIQLCNFTHYHKLLEEIIFFKKLCVVIGKPIP